MRAEASRPATAVIVHPGRVAGTVRVPGSKSVTHRAYVLAARSDRPVTIADPLRAADPDATLACLHALGARMQVDERSIAFEPAAWLPPRGALDCRNAGTGLRLLTAQVATQLFPVVLTGDDSLQSRPNGPLLDALRTLGASVRGDRDGRCPYEVQGPMRAGKVALPQRASSQFASALLLSLPLLSGPSSIQVAAPVRSAPYLEVTRQVMAQFGIAVHTQAVDDMQATREWVMPRANETAGSSPAATDETATPTHPAGEPGAAEGPARALAPARDGLRFDMAGDAVPRCAVLRVPADWSTAAFPLAAAAVTGGKVHVQGPRADDPQGDRAIASILSDFGAHVHVADDAVTLEGAGLETPGTVVVGATPDLFPALCAVAACARGTTTFVGGEALRHKESDRIAAMAAGLTAMGIDVEERADGLVVQGLGPGRKPRGATVATHADHRIHMALAVLALAADAPTTLDAPACVGISYPSFHRDLAALQEGA